MDSIERKAPTKEQAIKEALEVMNATESEVDIVVLDEGSKGLFLGIGSRPARIKVIRKPDPVQLVKNFLREVTLAMGLSVRIETNLKERHLYVTMFGENMGILIGKRGQTLDALQYLTHLAINKNGSKLLSITLDTENYRKRRRETLEALAKSLARRVKDKKQPIKLEPMSSPERRAIHITLQYDKFINTYSEGEEPFRNVVIAPK